MNIRTDITEPAPIITVTMTVGEAEQMLDMLWAADASCIVGGSPAEGWAVELEHQLQEAAA